MRSKRSESRHQRCSILSGLESLEVRRVLSGDGIVLGPMLSEFPENTERTEEIAAQLLLEIDNAVEVVVGEHILFEDEFETPDDVDVFKFTTPALNNTSASNGMLSINAWSQGTGMPSITVLAKESGELVYAELALAPFFGFVTVEVEPETTYVFAVGQVDLSNGDPHADSVGNYNVDISYFELLPAPPEPDDVEGDTPTEAAPIVTDLVDGYLNSGGDVDYFKFTATQDGTLNLLLDMPPTTLAELRIEAADGSLLVSETTFLAPVEAILDVEEGEDFYISVRATEGEGYYSFWTFEGMVAGPTEPPADMHGDTLDTATDLADLGPFAFGFGAINSADDVDVFKTAGGSFAIQINGVPTLEAELTNQAGEVLQTFVIGNDELLTFANESAGDVYLRISSGDFTELAHYDFFVIEGSDFGVIGIDPDAPGHGQVVPPQVEPLPVLDQVGDTPATATPLFTLLELGFIGTWAAEGRLNGFHDDGELDVDFFSAAFERDAELVVETQILDGPFDPETQFEFIDADGVVLAIAPLGSGVDVSIPEDGEYFVRVSSSNESHLGYQIIVSQASAPSIDLGPSPGVVEWTVEELADMLGLDPANFDPAMFDGEVDPDLGGGIELEPSVPHVMTLEEFAQLLGLDPSEFVDPSTVPTPAEFDSDVFDGDLSDPDVSVPLNETEQAPADPQTIDVLMGDIDGDNSVGFEDFLTLSKYYGTEQGAEWIHGNFDGDGDVDFTDFLALSLHYGQTR